jgi:HEAT repeat protein
MFDAIIQQLQSPDARQRSDAVFQLQPDNVQDERAISVLVDVLCHDSDLNVVEDATWVLVRYGTRATPELLDRIANDSAQARHNIVHALGKLGDVAAVPALIKATQDDTVAVRQKAVYGLGQIGDSAAIDALIKALGDSVQDVQWTAREALEGFGEKAFTLLVTALTDESSQIRELAAGLLGILENTDAVQPLISALQTEDALVRFAIIEALGNLGDTQALPVVEHHLTDSDSRVVAMAKVALAILKASG